MTRPRNNLERRLKPYNETHQELIETAVRLISEQGAASLSISSVAREMGIDRTTVYYHFGSREALLSAVKAWSTEQLSKAFSYDVPTEERVEYTIRYALQHPELMKLWIDDFISGADIRQCYPHWDAVVSGIQEQLDRHNVPVDAEVVFLSLLTNAIIAPRVYKLSIRPDHDSETVVQHFKCEHLRILEALGISRE